MGPSVTLGQKTSAWLSTLAFLKHISAAKTCTAVYNMILLQSHWQFSKLNDLKLFSINGYKFQTMTYFIKWRQLTIICSTFFLPLCCWVLVRLIHFQTQVVLTIILTDDDNDLLGEWDRLSSRLSWGLYAPSLLRNPKIPWIPQALSLLSISVLKKQ